MSTLPSTFSRIGFNKVGKRNAQLNRGRTERFQLFSGPRKLVQIHVLALNLAFDKPKRSQVFFSYNRRIIQRTEDGMVKFGNTVPESPEQRPSLVLIARSIHLRLHWRGPLSRMRHESSYSF